MKLRESFAGVAVDRESIPQGRLDIVQRVRTNPFPWTGQFSPQLIEQLLGAFAPPSSIVLDPFVGSGTLLGEAARLGLTAHGCDVNPAAVILARVYGMANLSEGERDSALGELRDRVVRAIGLSHGPLFAAEGAESEERLALENALVQLWSETVPGTMRNLAAALVVLCDFHRKTLDKSTVEKSWLLLEKMAYDLPKSKGRINVHHADARTLPVDADSIDLVLTSPPYINVHNYHQKYRRSVEAMGWNVLAHARGEIGSNRQNRGNRFLTVIQYSLDMALVLREMVRVTRYGARLILVLGRESTVRGTPFLNGELVAEIGVRSVGLVMDRRQERVFRNRYGTDIYEDILHFRSSGEVPDEGLCLTGARQIAGETLSNARSVAPDVELPGLEDALARLSSVSPSPLSRISVQKNGRV